jgi:bifunctional UDP-N-acetylglucosamine pyrophosphorylase/glucosamine-1-phosphate N-acetyltransferase
MKSALPKTLHPIAGKPMLRHLLDSCAAVFDHAAVVVGPETEAVGRAAAPFPAVVQHERRGTAHAALTAEALFGDGEVAILYADNPLIEPETLRRLLARRRQGDAGLALLAMRPADPGRYGRVITERGFVERIVEYRDASPAERAVDLCNAGVLCAAAGDMRRWLRAVKDDNTQKEFYLTDVVALARAEGARVAAVEAAEEECLGINARAELARAEAVVQHRLRLAAMDNGATLVAPETVFLSYDTVLGRDITIHPHVVIGPGVTVGDGVEVRSFSHLEGCIVREGAVVGPFARLRPGADLGEGAHVGNFVEVKATRIGAGAKANHLAYLGDAEVGARSNIGAGTITCNYDGFDKHRTIIGADVFVGSDSVLVAPVTIGDGAFVTAGSVITHDVEPHAMAFGRARQEVRPGRAAEFRARRKGTK